MENGTQLEIADSWTRIPKANTDPAMYSVNCLGEFILNVLSECKNTKESFTTGHQRKHKTSHVSQQKAAQNWVGDIRNMVKKPSIENLVKFTYCKF
jgi:hypothetical protein